VIWKVYYLENINTSIFITHDIVILVFFTVWFFANFCAFTPYFAFSPFISSSLLTSAVVLNGDSIIIIFIVSFLQKL
jgi:hypothetical protein